MRGSRARSLSVAIAVGLSWMPGGPAAAGWEVGAQAGYDSNVDRSVERGQGDEYLYAYATMTRDAPEDRRIGWYLSATVDGAAYAEVSGVNYASGTLSPGVSLVLGPTWSTTASLFGRGKVVDDGDQSALAFGGSLGLRQRPTRRVYLGEYYAYTDSRARVETFSYTEHALGAYAGMVWTSMFRSELGYEFTRGESFRTFDGDASAQAARNGAQGGGPGAQARGPGGQRRFSSAFGKEVVRETVDGHSIRLTAGLDWTASLTWLAGYEFSVARGDLGSSVSHAGYLGLAYRH